MNQFERFMDLAWDDLSVEGYHDLRGRLLDALYDQIMHTLWDELEEPND